MAPRHAEMRRSGAAKEARREDHEQKEDTTTAGLSRGRFSGRRGRLRLDCNTQSTEPLVPAPNYRFKKQQRELKKTKQKEEKLRKKQERSDTTKPEATPEETQK